MEQKIRYFFEHNYELLKLDGGHALTGNVKEEALQQVLMYWRKLKYIAQKATDAEVRLSLPNQETPKGRKFSINGVVDIIRDDDQIHMYDVKTHDLEYITENRQIYQEQLSIYAHIWHQLRSKNLDFVAVISTALPKNIKQALRINDEARLCKALSEWNPLVPIDINEQGLTKMIKQFGEVVDNIEDRVFVCPPEKTLNERFKGSKQTFATKVCSNCDGRFSCKSYRAYARNFAKGKTRELSKYFESSIDKDEQEDWLEANSIVAEMNV